MKRHHVLILACIAVVAHPAWADTILLDGKPALSGVKVMSESAVEVKYVKGSGRPKSVSSSEVLGIIYDSQPRDYRVGVEYFNLGDFTNAMTRLRLAADAGDGPGWVKEYANVYLGRTYLASGDFANAIAAFERVLAIKADTRWLGTVSVGLAKAHIGEKQYAQAKSALENLKAKAASLKMGGNWAEKADLYIGVADIAAGNFDQATDALKRVSAATKDATGDSERAELFVQAQRLEAEAHIDAEDLAKAKIVHRELLTSRNRFAEAAARVLGAELILLEGKSPEEFMRAAYALTQAHVENFGVVSEMPRTCYLLGLVHLKLVGTLDKAKELAKGYFEETRRRFPESREAFLAREELKKM